MAEDGDEVVDLLDLLPLQVEERLGKLAVRIRDGRPAPPRKNDQNRGEVAGQNKGPNFNFLQQQNNITTLNNAQSGLSIGYARESKK